MALSYVASSAWVFGTGTTLTPAVPTGLAVGDLLIAFAFAKYDASTIAVPSGWTDLGQVANTGRSAGNDNGNLRGRGFWKIAVTADLSAGPTITFGGTINMVGAVQTAYRVGSGNSFSVQGTVVKDDAAGSGSVPLVATLSIATDDILHSDCAVNTDATTGGSVTRSTPGVTWAGGITNVGPNTTASGTDASAWSARATATAGPSTGDTTCTWAWSTTLPTNFVGLGTMVRIREVAPTALVVQDAAHSVGVENVVVSGVPNVLPQDSAHAVGAEALALVMDLAVAGALQSQSAENVVLSGSEVGLVPQDVLQGHSAEAVTLSQLHLIAPNDALHASQADSVILTQLHLMAVADALQSQSADAPALTQLHLLTLADAAHAHTADTFAVTQIHLLVVADASHVHAAEALALAQVHVLAVAHAENALGSDSPVLAQLHVLAIADAVNSHTVDGLVLTQVSELVVDGAAHDHLVEGALLLTQLHVLVMHDAASALNSDSPVLAGTVVLVIADTVHVHGADTITPGGSGDITVADAIHVHVADVVAFVKVLAALHVTTVRPAAAVRLGTRENAQRSTEPGQGATTTRPATEVR